MGLNLSRSLVLLSDLACTCTALRVLIIIGIILAETLSSLLVLEESLC